MQRNGSETSSTPDTSPEATLTSGASLTLSPTTSADTPKPISSLASADGRSPSASRDGPTIDLFGQAHAHASPSAPPAKARRPMTNATCGLRGFLSSPSASLQQSLENRLKRRLDGAGSTLFSLTWRAKATPAGRPYSQLAASGRRTSDNDCGSWPTPNAGPQNDTDTTWQQRRIELKAKHGNNGFGMTMGMAAQLASWPTPMAGTPAQKGYNEAGNTDSGRKVVALASWPTPDAYERGGPQNPEKRRAGGHSVTLQDAASLASWATPTSRDHKDSSSQGTVPINGLLGRQAWLASGPTPNGFPAQTEKPGQLDPDHSRWVMGYSAEHLSCAPTETLSFLKSRRSS
jgi:hypothetical protein